MRHLSRTGCLVDFPQRKQTFNLYNQFRSSTTVVTLSQIESQSNRIDFTFHLLFRTAASLSAPLKPLCSLLWLQQASASAHKGKQGGREGLQVIRKPLGTSCMVVQCMFARPCMTLSSMFRHSLSPCSAAVGGQALQQGWRGHKVGLSPRTAISPVVAQLWRGQLAPCCQDPPHLASLLKTGLHAPVHTTSGEIAEQEHHETVKSWLCQARKRQDPQSMALKWLLSGTANPNG